MNSCSGVAESAAAAAVAGCRELGRLQEDAQSAEALAGHSWELLDSLCQRATARCLMSASPLSAAGDGNEEEEGEEEEEEETVVVAEAGGIRGRLVGTEAVVEAEVRLSAAPGAPGPLWLHQPSMLLFCPESSGSSLPMEVSCRRLCSTAAAEGAALMEGESPVADINPTLVELPGAGGYRAPIRLALTGRLGAPQLMRLGQEQWERQQQQQQQVRRMREASERGCGKGFDRDHIGHHSIRAGTERDTSHQRELEGHLSSLLFSHRFANAGDAEARVPCASCCHGRQGGPPATLKSLHLEAVFVADVVSCSSASGQREIRKAAAAVSSSSSVSGGRQQQHKHKQQQQQGRVPAWLQQSHSLRQSPLPSAWPSSTIDRRGVSANGSRSSWDPPTTTAVSKHFLCPIGELPLDLGSWPSCWPSAPPLRHAASAAAAPVCQQHRHACVVQCSHGRTVAAGALARALRGRYGMAAAAAPGRTDADGLGSDDDGTIELRGGGSGRTPAAVPRSLSSSSSSVHPIRASLVDGSIADLLALQILVAESSSPGSIALPPSLPPNHSAHQGVSRRSRVSCFGGAAKAWGPAAWKQSSGPATPRKPRCCGTRSYPQQEWRHLRAMRTE